MENYYKGVLIWILSVKIELIGFLCSKLLMYIPQYSWPFNRYNYGHKVSSNKYKFLPIRFKAYMASSKALNKTKNK